jgi:hypothetical protein
MAGDKKLEYKFDEIYHEVIISFYTKLYKKSGVDSDNSGFASVLRLPSSKSYFETLIGSGGNEDVASLALLNTLQICSTFPSNPRQFKAHG